MWHDAPRRYSPRAMETSRMLDWSPLGELAVLVRCRNEAAASSLARQAREWAEGAVQAYASVTVFFERPLTHEQAIARLESAASDIPLSLPRRHTIPVCYERGLDFEGKVENDDFTREELAELWPIASIPVLRDGDRVVAETSIIIEYLDRLEGDGPRLIPDDPEEALRPEDVLAVARRAR